MEAWRAVGDVGPLLRFRSSGVRGRSRTAVLTGLAFIAVVTVLAGWLPGYLPEGDERRTDVLLLLPSAYIGVLVISMSRPPRPAVAVSCCRVSRRVAYPVSPTTDHLGALLMAPLNIAWICRRGRCSAPPPTSSARVDAPAGTAPGARVAVGGDLARAGAGVVRGVVCRGGYGVLTVRG